MPYFRNPQMDILLIHIPKTGGTSIETYFSKKFNIHMNEECLFSSEAICIGTEYTHTTLQHLPYKYICQRQEMLRLDLKKSNLLILSVVRNPYKKVISELFYFKMIQPDSTPAEVLEALKQALVFTGENNECKQGHHDNHFVPQCAFLLTESYQLIPNLRLLKTESLKEDMKDLGFLDFDLHVNQNELPIQSYVKYLNHKSIRLINHVYDLDFRLFGYEKWNGY